jgi:hypothetical protein
MVRQFFGIRSDSLPEIPAKATLPLGTSPSRSHEWNRRRLSVPNPKTDLVDKTEIPFVWTEKREGGGWKSEAIQ